MAALMAMAAKSSVKAIWPAIVMAGWPASNGGVA